MAESAAEKTVEESSADPALELVYEEEEEDEKKAGTKDEAEVVETAPELPPSLYGIKPVLKDKFNIPAVREIIISTLQTTLEGQVYSTQYAKTVTQSLATDITKAVKDLQQNRYKHIVQVTMGEQKGAGVKSAMRSLWDVECDTYVSEQYKNSSLFCLVIVFGIYFY